MLDEVIANRSVNLKIEEIINKALALIPIVSQIKYESIKIQFIKDNVIDINSYYKKTDYFRMDNRDSIDELIYILKKDIESKYTTSISILDNDCVIFTINQQELVDFRNEIEHLKKKKREIGYKSLMDYNSLILLEEKSETIKNIISLIPKDTTRIDIFYKSAKFVFSGYISRRRRTRFPETDQFYLKSKPESIKRFINKIEEILASKYTISLEVKCNGTWVFFANLDDLKAIRQ